MFVNLFTQFYEFDIYILVGSAIGSPIALCNSRFYSLKNTTVFPVGTFTVNIVGSY